MTGRLRVRETLKVVSADIVTGDRRGHGDYRCVRESPTVPSGDRPIGTQQAREALALLDRPTSGWLWRSVRILNRM